MRANEINIRDPFVLVHGGKYYLYGTRSETCWGPAEGFDCYVSSDMKSWDGPVEIFRRPDDFFATEAFWAPECVARDDGFYLLTTFGGPTIKKGIYVLRADRPEGPFAPYGERLTPEDWTCIDGTLHVEDGRAFLVYSHSFEDTPDGDMCLTELSPDLSRAISEPVVLFSAAEAPWARPVPFAKAEFGMDGDVYFTDGPCLFRAADGSLNMTWSSWSEGSYAVGLAVSQSGSVAGPWRQRPEPLWPRNGGHGMAFWDLSGNALFTLHYPNDKGLERPCWKRLVLEEGSLKLTDYQP